MQLIRPVHDCSGIICQGCLIDISDIRYHRADAAHLHALLSAHAHAPAQHSFPIRNFLSHLQVFVVRAGIRAVMLSMFFTVTQLHKVTVSKLLA